MIECNCFSFENMSTSSMFAQDLVSIHKVVCMYENCTDVDYKPMGFLLPSGQLHHEFRGCGV